MAKIFALLNNATADTVGSTLAVGGALDNAVAREITLQYVTSGLSNTMDGTLYVEVSLDGSHWWPYEAGYILGGVVPLPALASQPPTVLTVSTPDLPFTFRYIRARISGMAGGSSPSITAIASLSGIEPVE